MTVDTAVLCPVSAISLAPVQDMVPRMSLWTIERLRDEMMICALRCKVSRGAAGQPCLFVALSPMPQPGDPVDVLYILCFPAALAVIGGAFSVGAFLVQHVKGWP